LEFQTLALRTDLILRVLPFTIVPSPSGFAIIGWDTKARSRWAFQTIHPTLRTEVAEDLVHLTRLDPSSVSLVVVVEVSIGIVELPLAFVPNMTVVHEGQTYAVDPLVFAILSANSVVVPTLHLSLVQHSESG
jgi:hypothetical protein